MSEINNIIQILNSKSSTKQLIYRKTKEIFADFTSILKEKIELLHDEVRKNDSSIFVEFSNHGSFETHIKFSGDALVFHMHTNVFDFPSSHNIHKTNYVKEDTDRSFCGVINVYNFLSDSFKYNRMNDVGNLICRIFINKENHYFVEGEKQLGFLFDDFSNQVINKEAINKIIDMCILFALDFDLMTPNFKDVNLISLHQILDMNNSHKLKTSKSLGFKLSYENK